MGYLIFNTDRNDEIQGLRSQMRQRMRRSSGSGSFRMDMPEHSEQFREGYRQGFKHGWEERENEMDEDFRRGRDNLGRYV